MFITCRRALQRGVLLAFALLLAGCTGIVHKPLTTSAPGAHKIAIFFDGTHNDIASDTNIKRLHSLVSLQGNRNISTVYIEGVGTGMDPLGAGSGWGMGPRVRIGYEFILNHYRHGDEIYIFGFSRGAYAARILASMLYNVGIVAQIKDADTKPLSAFELADMAFDAFKFPLDEEKEGGRRAMVTDELKTKGLAPSASVSVDVLGLWDTVEALGIPNWTSRLLHKAGIKQHIVNIDVLNTRYGDQLCNVKRAYQALAIDDNREWIFTPLPLDRTHLFRHCAGDDTHIMDKNRKIRPGRLREVWFSGAHSDVGGGYADSLLSGVSLNWMIANLQGVKLVGDKLEYDKEQDAQLLPAKASVPEDPFGTSHDPEAGWWGPLYHAVKRDLGTYATYRKPRTGNDPQQGPRRDELRNTLCIHHTVKKRRQNLALKPHENDLLSLQKAGIVHLMPDKDEAREGWRPRWREAPDPNQSSGTTLEVQIWPDCESMR